MLRTLLRLERTFYIARQESAPLLREREVFLEHLLQQGTSIAAARCVSWQLLNVIRLLKLTRLRGVRIDEIEEAAKKWTRQQRLAKFACQHIERLRANHCWTMRRRLHQGSSRVCGIVQSIHRKARASGCQ
jgi:hypothetical protein